MMSSHLHPGCRISILHPHPAPNPAHAPDPKGLPTARAQPKPSNPHVPRQPNPAPPLRSAPAVAAAASVLRCLSRSILPSPSFLCTSRSHGTLVSITCMLLFFFPPILLSVIWLDYANLAYSSQLLLLVTHPDVCSCRFLVADWMWETEWCRKGFSLFVVLFWCVMDPWMLHLGGVDVEMCFVSFYRFMWACHPFRLVASSIELAIQYYTPF